MDLLFGPPLGVFHSFNLQSPHLQTVSLAIQFESSVVASYIALRTGTPEHGIPLFPLW